MKEFNPKFSFDIKDDSIPVQTPWDFSDALRDATLGTGTSIDHKIKERKYKSNLDYLSDDTLSEKSDEDALLPGEEEVVDEETEEDKGVGAAAREGTYEAASTSSSDHEQEDCTNNEINIELGQLKPGDKGKDAKAGMQNVKGLAGQASRQFFDSTPTGVKFSASTFVDLNLSRPLIRACEALGYTKPTPIQAACIPLALTGRDICGSAITGSGKTGAFSLPILERLLHRDKRVSATYVLILVPARELAVQVHSMMERFAQFTDIRVALVVGGLSLAAQAAALRAAPEIVVGTPGRVIDHLRNSQGFGLEDLSVMVLDEADRLLEMGFKDEVHEILKATPLKRQTLLFSATMTDQVKDLVSLSLKHPVRLAADESAAAPKMLTQEVIRLKGKAVMKKEALLLALISRSFMSAGRVIIFFSTKQKAHRAKILFGLADFPMAVELHGDMTQAARLQSLEMFRTGKADFLLATDVAARGLDILGVETVINYDCPRGIAGYLHRIGRTARAGASGRSISFVEDEDRPLLKEIVKKAKINLLSRKVPSAAIETWHQKVEDMEQHVVAILKSEREEKELRKAELEVQRASNIIDHHDEIYSRPARTWFQTPRERKNIEIAAREAAMGLHGEKDEQEEKIKAKIGKNAAKSQRRLERKRAAQAAENDANPKSKSQLLLAQTKDTAKRVRALKAKEQELKESGLPTLKASKIAASIVVGHNKKKSKKRELFSDGSEQNVPSLSRVYAGGAKTAIPIPTSHKLQGKALNKVRRGGKGKHAFKSKSRHRRRT